MGYDWTRGLSGGAKGAASGAAMGTTLLPGVGTAIGAGLGGLLGLAGGIGGESDEAENLYRDLLKNYKDPTDPAQLEQLDGIAKTGLSSADRAAILRQYSSAAQMAHGREGAIQDQAAVRGGGDSVGNSQIQQGQAAQAATQRAFLGGLASDEAAGSRRMQALQLAMQQRAANAKALNDYKLAVAGRLAGIADSNHESGARSIADAASSVGASLAGMAGQFRTPAAPAASGAGLGDMNRLADVDFGPDVPAPAFEADRLADQARSDVQARRDLSFAQTPPDYFPRTGGGSDYGRPAYVAEPPKFEDRFNGQLRKPKDGFYGE